MSSEGNKVAAFITNGGGTITFRVALGAVAMVTLWLLQSFGSHIVGQLDDFSRTQSRMAATLATLAQKGNDTALQTDRNSARIDDHEGRITWIEAHQPVSDRR